MGSGSSSNAPQKRTDEQVARETASSRPVSNTSTTKRAKIITTKIQPFENDDLQKKDLEPQNAANEDRLNDMEKLMAEMEVDKLNLMDQVQSLEQQVFFLQNAKAVSEDRDYSERCTARDLCVVKLEQQLAEAQAQTRKIRLQYKKKLKQFNITLAECQQGCSVKVFEYKDEIQRLTDENHILSKRLEVLHNGNENQTSNSDELTATSSDGRNTLVLQLSMKVSEQQSEIIRLENLLRKCDRIAPDLGGKSSIATSSLSINPGSKRTWMKDYSTDLEVHRVSTDNFGKSSFYQVDGEQSSVDCDQTSKEIDLAESESRKSSSSTSRDSGVVALKHETIDRAFNGKTVTKGNKYWETSQDSSAHDDWDSGNEDVSLSKPNESLVSNDNRRPLESYDVGNIRKISAPHERRSRQQRGTKISEEQSSESNGLSTKKPPVYKKQPTFSDGTASNSEDIIGEIDDGQRSGLSVISST